MGLFNIFRHETRIRDLDDRLRTLESTIKGLELEWSDTYDKVRSILGKIAKRQERAAATPQEPPGSLEPEQVDPGGLDLNERIRRSRRGTG